MNGKRVVITGTGAISSVGNSVPEFWDAVVAGKCGIGPITRFDASEYRTRIAGEVKNFDVSKYMPFKEAKRLDLFCQYAIAATAEALENAGLPQDLRESNLDLSRIGVLVSSGIGGLMTLSEQHQTLLERGPGKVSPFLIPMMIGDLASGNISIRTGAKGPNMGIVTACATGSHSIGEAYWMIQRNDADMMICGGAEASIVPLGLAGFCALKALSTRNDDPLHASRPFDAQRDGFVMSEGAGVLIIEELEHAKRRNANILADIKVDYYGQPTPVTQLAGVKVPEASMLVVEPWDKSSLRAIEKAIESSDLGITPSNDGVCIRLPFPRPTEERRRELAKECSQMAEDSRVAVRNARRDANARIERDEELSEDEQTREKKRIQKLTDTYVAKVDELLKAKTAEVMEI